MVMNLLRQGKKQSSRFLCEKDEPKIKIFLAFSVLGMTQNGTMGVIGYKNNKTTIAVKPPSWAAGLKE